PAGGRKVAVEPDPSGERPRAFEGEEPSLVVETAAEAAEAALRHDAVAGHEEGHRVLPARSSDGPHRLRLADRARDLRVGPRLPVRDPAFDLPDRALERRPAE